MGAPQNRVEPAGNGFERVHRIAQSPLGELWVALDQRAGTPGEPVLLRYVALSEGATQDVRERVASAARAAMGVRSEHVLRAVHVLDQGQLAVAYEYSEAQPLSALQSTARARGLAFPVGVALRLGIDLLRGLQAVHEGWPGWPTDAPFGGLLPASVLVSADGQTRLCDAMIASSALLQRGFGLGAAELAYRAPEQVYASTAPEPATDVFTAAILLWELLSGRRLLSGRKETIERRLLEHDLPRWSDEERPPVPRGLIELVERGLSLDPTQRPATPGAFAAALERCGAPVASHAELAAFVTELAGTQLERLGVIVRLALGYATEAELRQAEADARQPEAETSQTGLEAPRSSVAAAESRGSQPPPGMLPPPAPALLPEPGAVPRSGVMSRSDLAQAVARSLARHRSAVGESQPPEPPAEPRTTSLGLGVTAQPAIQNWAAVPISPAHPSQPPPLGSAPPVPALPVLPVAPSAAPLPLQRRRPAAPSPAAESAVEVPASQVDPAWVQSAQRERTRSRAYAPSAQPPAPVRLAPKRALLAAMASVVLAVQLWMFNTARLQRQHFSSGLSERGANGEMSRPPAPGEGLPEADAVQGGSSRSAGSAATPADPGAEQLVPQR